MMFIPINDSIPLLTTRECVSFPISQNLYDPRREGKKGKRVRKYPELTGERELFHREKYENIYLVFKDKQQSECLCIHHTGYETEHY